MALAEKAMTDNSIARQDVLVEPHWLAEHLFDPDLRVIEIDVSPVAYGEGHIDGALLWNVYKDLKDSEYRLVDSRAIEDLFERSGIDPGSTVVFYGYAPAMGFWLMKLYGHQKVRILDCDRDTWREGGCPWTNKAATPIRTKYGIGSEDRHIRANHNEVEAAIGDPSRTVLDVRSEAEFRGQRFWPSGGLEPGGRAGHVPNAVNVSVEGVFDADGAFRTSAELRQIFSSIDTAQSEVISYCTIGGRAATAWFVLTYLLGWERVRVYDGSWAEWGRMPATPVAQSG